MNILSIDAWRYDGGWTWNNWFKVGTISRAELKALSTTRKILAYMRREGYLSQGSAGRVSVDDDGYNVVVCAKGTLKPLFAIEYGAEVEDEQPPFPVRELSDGENPAGAATCGVCHRRWDDSVSTGLTPTPAGRCPFEDRHNPAAH